MNTNYVTKFQVKECSKCHQPITFTQNRQGKWYPVDVHYDSDTHRQYYRSGIGAHGNMTPWHKCGEIAEAVKVEATPVDNGEMERDLRVATKEFRRLVKEGKMDEAKAVLDAHIARYPEAVEA